MPRGSAFIYFFIKAKMKERYMATPKQIAFKITSIVDDESTPILLLIRVASVINDGYIITIAKIYLRPLM